MINKLLKWLRRIKQIQISVANNNNPKKYFNHCIHIPGLGKNLTMLGNNDINKYGDAIPRPIERNMLIIINEDCVKETVIAVPTKGAEQGVANIVAKKPLKKSFVKLLLLNFNNISELIKVGVLNSNIPNKLRINTEIIKAITIKNNGCWNCIPHPMLTPIDRKTINVKANNPKEVTIPKEVTTKLFLIK